MNDPILNPLRNFSSKIYIDETLKNEFYNTYFSKGVHAEGYFEDTFQEDYYTWHAQEPEYIEDINGEDVFIGAKYVPVKEYYVNYIDKKINSVFEQFILTYRFKLFKQNSENIEICKSLNLKELREIFMLIKKNEKIKKKYLKVIIGYFPKGIELFKKEYQVKEIGCLKIIDTSPKSMLYCAGKGSFNKNIGSLFDSLKDVGLIDTNSKKTAFKTIFRGKNVSSKIIWTGTISEFYYLIKKLNVHIKFKDLKNYKWKVASKCFYILDKVTGEEFYSTKLRTQKNPNKSKMFRIDKILSF